MHHGQANCCSESDRQALKEYLASGPERSVEDIKSFIATNFETDISNNWTFPILMQSIYYDKAADAYEASGATIPRFPGFGLSLNCKTDLGAAVFPRLAFRRDGETNWKANTLLHREVCMLRVLEELTNKPEWWLKVKDDEIAAKWKTEVLQMDWKTLVGLWAVFTEPMADAVIAELRAKADLYQETGLIPVMDYSACAIKSDKLMSSELVDRLKAALAPFEDVPDEAKDWHPGSDGKVLDLVHPSLWPLIYGRSRVLPDKTIGVTDCLKYAGTGYTLPTIDAGKLIKDGSRSTRADDRLELSTRYQWLPSTSTMSILSKTPASIQ
ncbi:hypothetical protein NLG97_g8112 [Lecanicillium saksenae]|uniref:Uncharacterized protein n=1 Tax=Lecanicillium saksenae TaxID=468837 RepID=A0ACC1QJY1_9HYPO|nr:hypothetical protein NLG97_g8112 [Lecanicillium saksenae]